MTPVETRFSISLLERDEIEAVMEVERRCFETSPWTPGQFRHELKIPFSRTFLARERSSGRVAGYVCRWAVGEEISILNLAVDPDFRRTGLGRSLVELILGEAADLGATHVTLEVRENNDAARKLYSTLGFVETGRRKDYYGKSDHALIMTKSWANQRPSPEGLCPNPDTGV